MLTATTRGSSGGRHHPTFPNSAAHRQAADVPVVAGRRAFVMSGRQLEDELFREAQGRGSRMITCEHLEKQMRQAMHGASQWDPAIVQPAAKVNMQEAGLTYDEKPRVSPDVASLTRDLADTTAAASQMENGSPPKHGHLKAEFLRRLSDELQVKLNVALHSLEPGSRMLTYEEDLGAGTFGTVVKAWCQASGKGFAVKRANDERGRISILREAKAFVRIPTHPNLIEMVAVYEDWPGTAIALELGSFDMLDAMDGGKFSQADLLVFMEDVARGTSHMHEHGFVHGDLKFPNIIITPLSGNRHSAKVSDLGLAYAIGEVKPQGSGTLGTLAPENFYDDIVAHPSQDVFGLGAMLIMVMVLPTMFRHDIFEHQMLWTTNDVMRMQEMGNAELGKYMMDLAWLSIQDTSEKGFGLKIVRPENLHEMLSSIALNACKTMRLLVHPVPAKRPEMPVVITFTRLLQVAEKQVPGKNEPSPPPNPAGAAEEGELQLKSRVVPPAEQTVEEKSPPSNWSVAASPDMMEEYPSVPSLLCQFSGEPDVCSESASAVVLEALDGGIGNQVSNYGEHEESNARVYPPQSGKKGGGGRKIGVGRAVVPPPGGTRVGYDAPMSPSEQSLKSGIVNPGYAGFTDMSQIGPQLPTSLKPAVIRMNNTPEGASGGGMSTAGGKFDTVQYPWRFLGGMISDEVASFEGCGYPCMPKLSPGGPVSAMPAVFRVGNTLNGLGEGGMETVRAPFETVENPVHFLGDMLTGEAAGFEDRGYADVRRLGPEATESIETAGFGTGYTPEDNNEGSMDTAQEPFKTVDYPPRFLGGMAGDKTVSFESVTGGRVAVDTVHRSFKGGSTWSPPPLSVDVSQWPVAETLSSLHRGANEPQFSRDEQHGQVYHHPGSTHRGAPAGEVDPIAPYVGGAVGQGMDEAGGISASVESTLSRGGQHAQTYRHPGLGQTDTSVTWNDPTSPLVGYIDGQGTSEARGTVPIVDPGLPGNKQPVKAYLGGEMGSATPRAVRVGREGKVDETRKRDSTWGPGKSGSEGTCWPSPPTFSPLMHHWAM